MNFFEEFKLQKNCEINLLIKTFFGLVEMIFELVTVSFSLPKWQAVKMTFFAPTFKPSFKLCGYIFLALLFFLRSCNNLKFASFSWKLKEERRKKEH